MSKKFDIFYSLPEIWDFCLDKIYHKKEYIKGLENFFKSEGISKKSLIMDAGCGSGFPTLDLISRGYNVAATDKSSEMVRQIKLNAKKRNLKINAKHIAWSELSEKFKGVFDLVYCRGNSLVYAASWEQNWIVPERSKEEILEAILNFYKILRPKGKLYVDVTKHNEIPHKETIGIVKTKYGRIKMIWQIQHDLKNRIRKWIIILKFLDSHQEKKYISSSYLLDHSDLIELFRKAGFKKIKQNVKVGGEKNYDVFVAIK